MLLKMYALSERAVIDRPLLRDSRFRFLPSARTASQIMLNYREYVLSKLWDNRDGGNFGAYCLLVRRFLPYLAYQMCTDEFWSGIIRDGMDSILNLFFYLLTLPKSAMELREYGYPTFAENREELTLASFDKDLSRVRAVESTLLMDHPDSVIQNAEKMSLNLSLFDSHEEFQQLMDPQWQKSADPYGDLRLASQRNSRVLSMLLDTGLLRLEDGGYFFAHDSMREIFCADWLFQALSRRTRPDDLKEALGRYHLSRAVCRRLGELCGEDCAPLRGALDSLRGLFDPINSLSLDHCRDETMEILSEDWIYFSNLIWLINMMLPKSRPLTSEELEQLLDADELPLEVPDKSYFPLLPMPSIQNLTLRFTLGNMKEHTRLTLLSCVEYAGAMGGSFATAAANLTEALLLCRGTLAGEDLSRLDLSRARLRTASLTGAKFDGAFLPLDNLREIDLPTDSGYRRMEYGPSGRFLYLAYTKTLFCLDLWEEHLVFSLAVSPETHGDAALVHFILLPEQGWLAVILSDNTVCIMNAGTGEGLLEFCPLSGDDDHLRLTCAVPEEGGRLGLQLEGPGNHFKILCFLLLQDKNGNLTVRPDSEKDHARYTKLEEFKNGKITRRGYSLQCQCLEVREYAIGENADKSSFRFLGRGFVYSGAVYSKREDRVMLLGIEGLEEYDVTSGFPTARIVFRDQPVDGAFLDEAGAAHPVTRGGRIWTLAGPGEGGKLTGAGRISGILKSWTGDGRRLGDKLLCGIPSEQGKKYITDFTGKNGVVIPRRTSGGWPAVLTGDRILLTVNYPDLETAALFAGPSEEPGALLCQFDPFPDVENKRKLMFVKADLDYLEDTACVFLYGRADQIGLNEKYPARAGLFQVDLNSGAILPVDTVPLLKARADIHPRLLRDFKMILNENRKSFSFRLFYLDRNTVLMSFFDAWLTLEVELSAGRVLERYDGMTVTDLRRSEGGMVLLLGRFFDRETFEQENSKNISSIRLSEDNPKQKSPLDLLLGRFHNVSGPEEPGLLDFLRAAREASKRKFVLRRLTANPPIQVRFEDATELVKVEQLEVSGASMRGVMPEPSQWSREFFRRCGAILDN
ncbi:hypothetical protein SDC9_56095 [bioreactor metagenome]|uniref:Uncharacterized protein n=1 Tax=bioreactor metagenome TaxID=1076179 RepID=A0A644X0W8_9ZZZZ